MLSGPADGDSEIGVADRSGTHSTGWTGGAADLPPAATFTVVTGRVTGIDAVTGARHDAIHNGHRRAVNGPRTSCQVDVTMCARAASVLVD